eukprot:1693104-Pleurochrysis_carterae.AAC.1
MQRECPEDKYIMGGRKEDWKHMNTQGLMRTTGTNGSQTSGGGASRDMLQTWLQRDTTTRMESDAPPDRAR